MEEHNKVSGRNAVRLKDRAIDELIGICKGILFDGSVSTGEAKHLFTWLKANPIVSSDWFGKDLYNKLIVSLEDGDIAPDEESALLKILVDITGRSEGKNTATTLPLCPNPPKTIAIADIGFVLTGTFAYGKRKDVEQLIKDRGGKVVKNPSRNTRYLVIGETGSDAWMHSTFGRKIEEAVNIRDQGTNISIISEEHFFNAIDLDAPPPEKSDDENNIPSFVHLIDKYIRDFETLEDNGFSFAMDETGISSYSSLEDGSLDETPVCSFFYNDENPIQKWSVTDGYSIKSFIKPESGIKLFITATNDEKI